jgi:hypothetical protein
MPMGCEKAGDCLVMASYKLNGLKMDFEILSAKLNEERKN